jgi:hypothetical protein
VQRREHQVAGQRRLDCDLRRLGVADLADHHDVRVGPQQGAQAGGEAEPGLGVHLHLLDPVELVLDRVLDRHDRAVRRVQLGQARVERRRLARPGRTGHENRAVRARDRGLEAALVGLVHPEPVQVHQDLARVEDAHDDRLAAHSGKRRHAQIDVVPVHREADAPVLRHALLGDVELGHDLHPRDQPRDEVARHRGGVEDDAVDAEAHPHVVPARLEVDVGDPATHGVGDHGVDELHDWGFVGRLAELDHLCLELLVPDLADRALQRPELVEQRVDMLRRGDGAPHLIPGGHRDVVKGEQVGGVGGRHEQRALGEEGDRDGAVAARLLPVDHGRSALVHVEDVEIDIVEPVALGQRLCELARIHDAGVDQRLAERDACPAAVVHDRLHHLALGEAELDDHVADASLDPRPLGGRSQPRDREGTSRGSLSFHT